MSTTERTGIQLTPLQSEKKASDESQRQDSADKVELLESGPACLLVAVADRIAGGKEEDDGCGSDCTEGEVDPEAEAER